MRDAAERKHAWFSGMTSPMRIPLSSIALCVGAAILAAYVGTAQALHWQLSGPNTLAAIEPGVFFGTLGSGVTIFAALRVPQAFAAWVVAVGVTLTGMLSGIVSFVLIATASAC